MRKKFAKLSENLIELIHETYIYSHICILNIILLERKKSKIYIYQEIQYENIQDITKDRIFKFLFRMYT